MDPQNLLYIANRNVHCCRLFGAPFGNLLLKRNIPILPPNNSTLTSIPREILAHVQQEASRSTVNSSKKLETIQMPMSRRVDP